MRGVVYPSLPDHDIILPEIGGSVDPTQELVAYEGFTTGLAHLQSGDGNGTEHSTTGQASTGIKPG